MKKINFFLLALLLMLPAINIYADLVVTATTSTNNGDYSPRNVLTIWIEDSNGNFVKNIQAKCGVRTVYLYTWMNKSGWNTSNPYQNIDGWTGATRNSHGTVSGTWDLTNESGQTVPFGTYNFRVEYTEEHAQGPLASGSINIGTQDVTETVNTSYIDVVAEYIAEVTTPTPTGTGQPTATATPTPTATATPPPVNIALWKPASASSEYAVTYGAKYANDGYSTTAWGSSLANNVDWLYVDLEVVKQINRAVLKWYGNYYPKQYSIYISSNMSDWVKIATINKSNSNIDDFSSTTGISCRAVAVLCEVKNSLAYGLAELELYEMPVNPTSTPTATALPTATPTGTMTPTPTALTCPLWEIGTAYLIGDCVTFEGAEYECIQGHTSIEGWTPAAVASLWKLK